MRGTPCARAAKAADELVDLDVVLFNFGPGGVVANNHFPRVHFLVHAVHRLQVVVVQIPASDEQLRNSAVNFDKS